MVRSHVLLILCITGMSCLLAQGPRAAAPDLESLVSDSLNPSARCGACHEEIYAMWQRSMHSAAFTDPIFMTSYLKAYWETGGAAKEVCIRCHAPAATLSGDLDLKEPISREGITCDFCHSIAAVSLDRPERPFQVTFDGAKRGPLADADSPVHEVIKSELHESSELCAGCHEYTNANGVPILSTYSEWKESPQAAEGKTCQHCHMPVQSGNMVRSGMGSERKVLNLHNISGGHSREQVRKAGAVRILGVRREGRRSAAIEVEVANVGSGHMIPTGLPTRKLTLEVTVFVDEREVRRFQRYYQKTVVDAEERPLTEDHRVMLEAQKISGDNRLHPGERRLEKFLSSVPSKGRVRAEAKLIYEYEPEVLSRQLMSIEIASDQHSP